MKLEWNFSVLLTFLCAISATDAARSSVSIRVSSYRSSRISSRSTYRYSPIYTRRLSLGVMGPVYFAYASRYPTYSTYRRTPIGEKVCMNYLALSNGSYVGTFSCPFLPDEPGNWTRCCGYANEEFCCDLSYNDSWKNIGISVMAIVFITVGCIIAVVCVTILVVICCIRKRALLTSEASGDLQSKPFASKPAENSIQIPPPYPTMEYGTIPVQPQIGLSGQPPYPPPPPYQFSK